MIGLWHGRSSIKVRVGRQYAATQTVGCEGSAESGGMQLPDQPPQAKGKILDHDAGVGEPDNEMVDQRARELADIAGLDRDESVEDFRRQAREELRGVDPNVPNDDSGPVADLIAEDDVIGESGGATAPATNAAMQGDEQTIGEQLYSEGIDEADHDRMTASRREERRDEP